MLKKCSCLVLLALWLLIGCSNQAPDDTQLQGRILLWHSWDPVQTQVLSELIAEFTTIHPEVTIVQSTIPKDELLERFETRASMGLGPDLLIGSSNWVRLLADQGLVQDLSEQALDTSDYLSGALDTLRYQDKQFGWPLALQTEALYYNIGLISESPETLQDLLRQAADGKGLALNTNFTEAFWGIPAFGGQLFDREGRLVLDQGGFANWLGWLKRAREVPSIIFDRDQETLITLFKEGQVAFYIDGPDVLNELQTELGEEMVGVALLPAGPNGAAGPFLRTEGLMLNSASSDGQTTLALRLARFLINAEQQRNLSRQAGLIPANLRVRVDPTLYPALAGFVAQSKFAVSVPNLPQMDTLLRYGNDAYSQALEGEGVVSLTEAAIRLTERVNTSAGFAAIQSPTVPLCTLDGEVQLWHPWSEEKAAALQSLTRTFARRCPGVFVDLTEIPLSKLQKGYQDATLQGRPPDLLLGPHTWIQPLASDGHIQDLGRMMDPALMQQYEPRAQSAIRFQGVPYGLPVALHLTALFYNAEQVADPARTLDDLRNQASTELAVGLPLSFENAFWGIPAFGSILTNDGERLILAAEDLVAWLAWLQSVQSHPGMILDSTPSRLKTLFIQREMAYLAGPDSWLNELDAALGQDHLRVIPLPAGSGGESGPLLQVDTLMLNPNENEMQTQLAYEFAIYVAGVEGQNQLMAQTGHIPVNVNVDTGPFAAVAGFLEQAKTSLLVSPSFQSKTIFEAGNRLYQDALVNGIPLDTAVGEFAQAVNDSGSIFVEIEETETDSRPTEGEPLRRID